ncbi:MAG TPA: amidase family protein [Vicinamibacteria bacterium]|nr:amidase family protein [Vicinamibacteria bacterium]
MMRWFLRLLSVSWLVLSSLASLGSAETLELTTASIADINAAFEAGALSSEKLVALCLARIEAYDAEGPKLNAVIAIHPEAVATARALDEERRKSGPRSPLHGIPVVLKDNFDTFDLPTTAGSFMLQDSIPPDDAFVVKKLRDAGAIVLAKLNMSELASGDTRSSLIGPMLNPHDLTRSPAGSSGGTGVAIAAAYAPLGLGTDTGGSVRGPAAANGIVGLKTTYGLVSRDGIVPLALSFDTAGPMAKNVYDIAVALGIMAGLDPADDSTRKGEGKLVNDYTQFLDADALNAARLGIARDFMGQDPDVDWVIEASLEAMRAAGATIVDVKFPTWLLQSRNDFYWTIRRREFRAQIPDYLKALGPSYPKTLADLLARSMTLTAPNDQGFSPNPRRWSMFKEEEESGTLDDYEYRAVLDHGLPLIRSIVEGVMREEQLDAIVYPTASRRPLRSDADPDPLADLFASATNIANLTGFPDLIVPAGFTGNGLPVTLSFLGVAFNEGKLLALGYAFEQKTRARRVPVHTPALLGERVEY